MIVIPTWVAIVVLFLLLFGVLLITNRINGLNAAIHSLTISWQNHYQEYRRVKELYEAFEEALSDLVAEWNEEYEEFDLHDAARDVVMAEKRLSARLEAMYYRVEAIEERLQ